MITQINPNPGDQTSSLFGILEGKAKARKTAAAADAAAKVEEAKQQTLLLEALAAKSGYTPKADADQADLDLANANSSSEKTLYIILAVVVLVVMVGLYFIMKRK